MATAAGEKLLPETALNPHYYKVYPTSKGAKGGVTLWYHSRASAEEAKNYRQINVRKHLETLIFCEAGRLAAKS